MRGYRLVVEEQTKIVAPPNAGQLVLNSKLELVPPPPPQAPAPSPPPPSPSPATVPEASPEVEAVPEMTKPLEKEPVPELAVASGEADEDEAANVTCLSKALDCLRGSKRG